MPLLDFERQSGFRYLSGAYKLSRLAAFLLLLLPLPVMAAQYDITAMSLDEDDLELERVDGLTWRGGIAIGMDDSRFGGLSALRVSRDGGHLTAVTDHGHWFQAELTYRDGILTGLRAPRLRPLLDLHGKPLSRRKSDAESLADTGNNGFIVSFERKHRLWRYDGAPDPTTANARRVKTPNHLRQLPNNGGIEAMTRLCDGRLLIVAEKSPTRQNYVPGCGRPPLSGPV